MVKQRQTVLVVDDDEETLNVLSRTLAAGGFDVIWARNGDDTLELLTRYHDGPLALMVVDVVLPGMSAPELVEEVTRIHPDAGAIFVSAYDVATVRSHGVDPDAMAFLPKPYDPADLLEAVRRALSNGSPPGEVEDRPPGRSGIATGRAPTDPHRGDDELSVAVGRAMADGSRPEEGARNAAATLRDRFQVWSLGIWLRENEHLRLFGYDVAKGVRGEIERKIVRSYEIVSPDAELPGPQAMRRRKALHFEADSSDLCLPVRMALAGLGADHLYALPIFDAERVVGCALVGAKRDQRLTTADQQRLGDALSRLAREYEAIRVGEGSG